MAHLLGAEAVHLAYPTQVVFEAVTLGVNDGARIGIVGRNGDGKSSLLGLLTGQLRPDSGRVTRRSGLRVNALSQTDTLDPNRTVGWTLIGDQPEHQWAGNPRIRDVVAGLVSDIAWDTPVSTLSGGQRRRVQLASLLVGEWDVIALDEPTNHLDIQGITWLADHLRRRWARNTGGLLVVTHDRWFLDEVATTTWEVHDGIVEPFEGGYAAYVLQRVERDRLTAAAEAKRQNLLRKELAWLRRGAPARTCKPKFRIEAANQLIADVPPPRNTVELAKLAAARLGKDVVDLLGVSVSYQPSGGRPVLRDIEWRIGPGERIGIVGANGAGKSTLLGLIAGTVQPGVGRVKRGKTVRLAVLDQHGDDLAPFADDRIADVLGRLELRSAVRRSTAESLFGQRLAVHSDFLGEQLQPLLDLTRRPPQVMRLQQRVNSPGWRRAMAARKRIDDLIDAQIADARTAPRPDDHMLTTLISGCSEEGTTLSDNEIRDSIVSLITAGYETTSGALAWAIYALLTVPGTWESAASEVARVLGGRVPAADDLSALTYLNGVVHETLRLYSPGVISARRVLRDLWFDGHRIRAGRLLIFSAYVTHRLPEIWPEPTEFRPLRWDPNAADYRKPAPHEFIPFSGGLHRCIGAVMATTEMTVILARLVARAMLQLPAQRTHRIRAANFAALRPWPGLTVEIRKSAPAQ